MKRTLAAMVLVATLLAPAVAQAGTKTRRYEGTTSDGTAIGFKILRDDDREFGLRAI